MRIKPSTLGLVTLPPPPPPPSATERATATATTTAVAAVAALQPLPPFNVNLDVFPVLGRGQTGSTVQDMKGPFHPVDVWNGRRRPRRYPGGNGTQLSVQKTYHSKYDCDRHSMANGGHTSASSANKAIMLHLNLFPKTMKSATVSSALRRQPLHNNNLLVNEMQFSRSQKIAADDSKFLRPWETLLTNGVVASHTDPRKSTDELNAGEITVNKIESTMATGTMGNATDHHELVQQQQQQQHIKDATMADNSNLETMAAEAQVASLFRFPVESLQQFQAHDAM